MLAFYGWTDRLLLNLLNTKLNAFPEEKADLFVLELDRVSRELVEAIGRTGAFAHIYYLHKPPFHKEVGPLSPWEKLLKLLSGGRYYAYYRAQLKAACKNTSYRMLLTGAFWSETLFLFRYFRKNSPNLTISMVEEGTTNYSAPEGWQFHCLPSGRLRERLMRLVYFPLTWRRARKRVERIYLYPLEIRLRQCDWDIPAAELPEINGDNPICLGILQRLCGKAVLHDYQNASAVFIGSPILPGYQDTFEETNALLRVIVDELGAENLAVKAHPNRNGGELFAKGLENTVRMDRGGTSLESVLINPNLEDKLLITRNSSVPFSVRAQSGLQPYVIYLHRLYDYHKRNTDATADEMAARLSGVCAPGRVFVPDTVEQLRRALRRWSETGSLREAMEEKET